MIPGWHSESGVTDPREENCGSAIRTWVTGTGSAGWECMTCGLGDEIPGSQLPVLQEIAASHECLPGLDNDDVTLSFWSAEYMADMAALARIHDGAAGRCTCRTASSSVTDWRAHTGSCPAGTRLAQLAIAYGLVTADDVRRHAGLAPAPETGLCWGPHPPGQDWPCGCTRLTRSGSLAGIPDPAPAVPYVPWHPEPPPLPEPVRACAGCGLSDHMRPAGYGTGSPLFPHLCTYCAELRGLSQAPRRLALALQRYRVRAPVLTLLATWVQALLAGLLAVRPPRAARAARGIRRLGTVVIPVPVAILIL
jgi:hypothetical protein